jgi:hypothetical protein
MTTETRIITIEHLERAVKWADNFAAFLRRELDENLAIDPNWFVELHEPEARRLIDGLDQVAEALRIVITDNRQRQRDRDDSEAPR